MFDSGDPQTGLELRQALQRLLGEGMAWQAQRPDRWFFAPQGRFWSPATHLRHLRKASTPLANALKLPRLVLTLRFGRHGPTSRSFAQLRDTYLGLIANGAKAGPFTPRDEAAPAEGATRRQEILTRWTSATVDLTNAAGDWSEASLDRIQLPHPLLGTISVREMLAFTVYHTAHHLSRIAERSEAGGTALI